MKVIVAVAATTVLFEGSGVAQITF